MEKSSERFECEFRFLQPGEASRLTEAIRVAYGDTYDLPWVYDQAQIAARLEDGTYVSCIAETASGELLCHEGMSLTAAGDAVGHCGQAVTMPAARGQHLFTRTKRYLMDHARDEGMAGVFSEATAAHPYSQRANVELGGQETGFLLGWIPASVANDAAAERRPARQSAALFYASLNSRPSCQVYAPERHREIVDRTLDACGHHGEPAAPPSGHELAARTEMEVEVLGDHGLALISVHEPGADFEAVIRAERHHLFHHARLDAVYVDLPLEKPGTALVSGDLERLGVSYSGVFPNHKLDGDVLRMQSLHRVRIKADDVSVASEHGRELLDYVLADLPRPSL